MKNKVAITKCGKYEYEEIKKSLYTLIENTDFPDVKGKKVLVKPNILSDSKAEKNITTNPLVVKAAGFGMWLRKQVPLGLISLTEQNLQYSGIKSKPHSADSSQRQM